MKPLFYIGIFLLLIPFQASLLNPVSLGNLKPDLGLILLYLIGLLTSPGEAALAGMGVGLLQDIGSTSFLGVMGITRGLVGLSAGMLGRRVLDIGSPSNSIFLACFSLLEGIALALFLQMLYGNVPFYTLLVGRILPQALYTGLLGMVLLQLMSSSKKAVLLLTRRNVRKEQ